MFCNLFTCCFKTNESSENEDNEDNDIKEIQKLNKIILKKKTEKRMEYFYLEKKIFNLQLTENYYVRVIDIYDADTITVILFFRNDPSIIKLRLFGIDTPEMKPKNDNENEIIKEKALAIIAKIVLTDLIKNNNDLLYIKTNGSEKYGRTLATLFLKKDDTTSINQKLIDLKLADSYYGKKKEKIFQNNYLNLEKSKKIIKIYEEKNISFPEKYKFIKELYPINNM